MTGFENVWDDESPEELKRQLAIANAMSDYFSEAYSDSARALLASEDIGWNRLGLTSGAYDQITLDEAKRVAKRLHGYRESNPLLARGLEIRNSYQFSDKYEIGTKEAESKISAQKWGLINDERNQESVFSLEALERIEGERYSAGQAFILYDRAAKKFQHISFQEIGDVIYNPDDSSEIWYVKREWSASLVGAAERSVPVTRSAYYPSSRYKPVGGYVAKIKGVEVDDTKRMIVDRVNLKAGSNLGIPDSFAAAPWALAYSAYLSDGSKVLAALAEWAWLVKPKKRPAAERAATSVRSERGAGGTLFTDMEVSSLPTSSAVDLNTGRPIAALVASALGVSIVLLLADPGQSGAYGTAQTLSDPNRRTMEARRERNTKLIEHCLHLLGVADAEVQWPKMSPGSDADEQSIVMQAWGSGLFHEDEVRGRLAELAHITTLHADPPEGFMYPNNAASLGRADVDADGQGGVSPDGSTDMSNGQGRDALGVGNLSHAKKSGTTQGGAKV